MKDPIELHRKFFIEREFERLDLFRLLAEKYDVSSVMYPESFLHITPSFVFPKKTYVDTDRRTKQIFQFIEVMDFIE